MSLPEKSSHPKYKHGLCGTPEYSAWSGMMMRCNNESHPAYSHYGGRGIKVCERWSDVRIFVADMGLRPTPKHSLDRIDNEGSYSPDNCRWADPKEQQRNKRTTKTVEYEGETLPLVELAERFGIEPETLRKRLKRDWPMERALS